MNKNKPSKEKSPAIPQPLDVVVADSVEQFAARVSLSRTTIYAMIKSGALVVHKYGRRTIIPRGEIVRQIELLSADYEDEN